MKWLYWLVVVVYGVATFGNYAYHLTRKNTRLHHSPKGPDTGYTVWHEEDD